jgi:hypothetical protein
MALTLTKAQVAFGGLPKNVVKLLEAWEPQPQRTELAYRDALAAMLRAACPPDARVEVEYRHGGTTTDVWLRWKGIVSNDEVFFELKRNLTKKTELDRLIGQLVQLDAGKRNIVVVLFGETGPGLLSRLRERCREFSDRAARTLIDDDLDQVTIVLKP